MGERGAGMGTGTGTKKTLTLTAELVEHRVRRCEGVRMEGDEQDPALQPGPHRREACHRTVRLARRKSFLVVFSISGEQLICD